MEKNSQESSVQVVQLSGASNLGKLGLHKFLCLLLFVLHGKDPRSQPGLDVCVNLLGEQCHGDGEVGQVPEVVLQNLQGLLSNHFINISEFLQLLVES